MTRSARIFAIAAALALPATAAAHHGWGWTENEESRLSGTIESISFGNPHMHLQLRSDVAGWSEGALWEVDLSPPIVARRSGFGPDAAKVGDKAVLTGHRARDKDVLGFKAETITVNGRTYDVYPQREKSLSAD
ncbi:hypothetical protein FHS61_001364 [Altererythrobacter atlanticus]|uniref:Uncharacterized protein n=1 Tax=Croceibacterium atlanticum TaxID=1267766 RepID=A0A0F7KUM1_9SPHN|nr:DUF6152 family protein [Croceibacterium atlanticum]AKH44048.1 hypothetical protein WYH_03028 [Croceibacterium atlanticum]MBB5732355.1 hypothetical protein [Croceibacterium atlanticum]